jgi:hypothetical protein
MFHSLGDEGCYGAAFNAFTTRDANGFLEGFVTKGADLEVIAPVGHVDSINTYNFSAGPNTYPTLHALIGIELKEWVAVVNGKVLGHTIHAIEPLFVKTNTVDQGLKATRSALGTKKAIEVMITQDEFESHSANLFDVSIIRNNYHPLLNRCSAGWMQLFFILNFNQAYTARPFRSQPRAMAQRRYVDRRTLGGFQNGGAIPCSDWYAVYGKRDVSSHGLRQLKIED